MSERSTSANFHTKEVTVSTRVSINDSLAIVERAKAAGITKSEFVRQAALTGSVLPPATVPSINREQWLALAKVGANLNQLAAHLNSGGISGDGVAEVLDVTRRLLAEVRAALLGAEGGRDDLPN
jgi:hypothetical protein